MEDTTEPKPKRLHFMKNKWVKISFLGMAGLLVVIWYVAVWAKP